VNYKFGLGLGELQVWVRIKWIKIRVRVKWIAYRRRKKFCLANFYSTKRFVIEFQGESLEQFLSYRAHFQRYQQFRGFWQYTATSSRSCLKYHYVSPHLELENDWNQSSSIPLADRQFVPPHLQEFVWRKSDKHQEWYQSIQ